MPPCAHITLPRQRIVDWHAELLKSAWQAASWCLEACEHFNSAQDIVRRLVGYPQLAPLLGAPNEGLELFKTDHPYDLWMGHMWGRRCSYYISNLFTGLRSASRFRHGTKDLEHLVAQLAQIEKTLSACFKRQWEVHSSPEKSLLSRGDIANFHITYLEPALFSSLYLLQRNRREKHSWDQRAEAILWRLIRDEVAKSTTSGDGKSEHMVDESTVWWGYIELLKQDRKAFKLGRHSGWRGAIQVCRNLIHTNGGAMRWPTPAEVKHEATPEVYGQVRTRILVTKNCIELASIVPSRSLKPISCDLSEFAEEQITLISGDLAQEVQRHVYLTGLALDLSTSALVFL